MAEQVYLKLHPSEMTVAQAASNIFAAYVASQQVNDGNEDEMISKSIRQAIKIAQEADESVKSDNEMTH